MDTAEESTGAMTPQSDKKSRRTRERILDATARVLSQKGYAGTRLSDVAEAAGLQAPAIYYHFGSREILIEEVMWLGMSMVRTHVKAALDDAPGSLTFVEKILVGVEAQLRCELQVSDHAMAAIRNSGQLPSNIRARQAEEEDEYGRMWRELFRGARRNGELRDGMNDKMSRMFVIGALNWAVEWWDETRGDYDELVHQAQEFVRLAIAARPESGEPETE